MSELITINKENALEVFTGEKLDEYLKKIEDDALSFVPKVSTDIGRKQIASKAHSIAKQKVSIDSIGKELVLDWKRKAGLVDASRKKSRDFLDTLRDKVRLPLTDWENDKKEQEEKERADIELAESQMEALSENELFDRHKEVERKETALKDREEERLEKERLAQEEKNLLEREMQIALDAKIKAEQEANEKIEAAERAKIEVEIKADLEKKLLIKEKELAVEKQRQIAVQLAQERIIKQQMEKKIAKEKSANIEHRRVVNNEILTDFEKMGWSKDQAKLTITTIGKGKIRHITINY